MNHSVVVQELKVWIEEQMERPQALTIECVAKKAGYSKWHLQRIFRDIAGENLGVYMRNRRLNLAAITLCISQSSIIDISIQYGFDSQQSFTRAFKKRFNCTPAKYRKNHDTTINTQFGSTGLDNDKIKTIHFY